MQDPLLLLLYFHSFQCYCYIFICMIHDKSGDIHILCIFYHVSTKLQVVKNVGETLGFWMYVQFVHYFITMNLLVIGNLMIMTINPIHWFWMHTWCTQTHNCILLRLWDDVCYELAY